MNYNKVAHKRTAKYKPTRPEISKGCFLSSKEGYALPYTKVENISIAVANWFSYLAAPQWRPAAGPSS